MISELLLSRNFGYFWTQLLPGAERYVRMINSGMQHRTSLPVETVEEPERRALVNVVASLLFADNTSGTSAELKKPDYVENVRHRALTELGPLARFPVLTEPLSPAELDSASMLSDALQKRFPDRNHLVVAPEFAGCGIVNASKGDLVYQGTLFEVKAGDRNFVVNDLRQLVTYAALGFSEKRRVEFPRIGLHNPRRGVEWSADLDTFARDVAGTTILEILYEVVEFVGALPQSQ